jgi:hypothetical protein
VSDQPERVFTITDYYDGPLRGIANFRGRPHAFVRMFDYQQDEYSNIYQLHPIDADTLRLALEQWDIWLGWEAAFYRREVELESHPALPAERNRYEELERILAPALEVPEEEPLKAVGAFRSGMEVLWEPLA